MAAIEEMLQRPQDPNLTFLEACWTGQAGAVRLLLEAAAEVNLADSGGETPLHLAAKQGHLELVHLLLEAKADTSLANRRGKTAAQVALDNDRGSIARLLPPG